MKSIKSVYKIGYGPSSSHTMGPSFAAADFMTKFPNADFIKVILYGSLAKTGKGHGTDRAIIDTLSDVKNEVISLPSDYQTTVYSPIYKYTVEYDNREDAGYFVFNKGKKLNDSSAFNPAVLASSTSAKAGATTTMNNTINYSFQFADNHMSIPVLERMVMKAKKDNR